jgi:hypothetical protein
LVKLNVRQNRAEDACVAAEEGHDAHEGVEQDKGVVVLL